jgi:hypothetical protein
MRTAAPCAGHPTSKPHLMPHATPCDQCSRSGLPILFTRYAAGYSASRGGMDALDTLKTGGTLQTRPSGVKLKAATCNVRMLRAGYLYIRLETDIRHPEWLGYAVHPHGYLTRFDIDHPENASAEPACRPDEWGGNRSLVWIKDADAITQLYFMFHPDPVDPGHLKAVIGKEPKKYMQSFDVAGWTQGDVNQGDTLLPDSLDIMVMEFKAVSDKTLQTVGCEQHYGLMGCSGAERQWGTYTEVKYGRHVSEGYRTDKTNPDPEEHFPTGTGPVGPARSGVYLHETIDRPYRVAHGPRLEKIAEHLKAGKGAVLACEDPIGVAQELALHHLTAAIPYIAWLKETDGADASNPKVTNQWKQAASETIKAMEAAFQKKAMGLYDESTDRLQARRAELERLSQGPPAQVQQRQPDGSYKQVPGDVFVRDRIKEIDEQIRFRAGHRDTASSIEALNAVTKTLAHYDADKRKKFDAAHAMQIKDRDHAMNQLTEDLIACICHRSFHDQALGRYRRDQRGLDAGDGVRCAAQLCTALSPMDSSPRGRAWYSSLNLFDPDPRNSVWRMVSMNNDEVSKELRVAMASLINTLPAASNSDAVASVEENLRRQKAYADMIGALGRVPKTVKAAQSIVDNARKIIDPGAPAMHRVRALQKIVKTAEENIHAVWCSAVVLFLEKFPVTEWERKLAAAQLITMATGLGKNAAQMVNADKQLELDRLQDNRVYQGNKSPSHAARNLKRQMLRGAERFDERVNGWTARSGGPDKLAVGRRLPSVLASVEIFSLLPVVAHAKGRGDDPRAGSMAAAALVTVVGHVQTMNHGFYEKGLLAAAEAELGLAAKTPIVAKGHATYVQRLTQLNEASISEIRMLKVGAAHYVAAASIFGVVWDVVDATKAYDKEHIALMAAYVGRSVAGLGTIGAGISTAIWYDAAYVVLWCTRITIVSAVITIAATIVIDHLKEKEWIVWLEAQPFRKDNSREYPHTSEKIMLARLSNAIEDMK